MSVLLYILLIGINMGARCRRHYNYRVDNRRHFHSLLAQAALIGIAAIETRLGISLRCC
jgi:hypothetical protein